jgi:hypothetical protein
VLLYLPARHWPLQSSAHAQIENTAIHVIGLVIPVVHAIIHVTVTAIRATIHVLTTIDAAVILIAILAESTIDSQPFTTILIVITYCYPIYILC